MPNLTTASLFLPILKYLQTFWKSLSNSDFSLHFQGEGLHSHPRQNFIMYHLEENKRSNYINLIMLLKTLGPYV